MEAARAFLENMACHHDSASDGRPTTGSLIWAVTRNRVPDPKVGPVG
jgi:hypothetical protein